MSYVESYIQEVKVLMDAVSPEQVEHLANLIEGVWKSGNRLLLLGNGGSSATASHIVNDFQKCLALECGKPIKAICLSDCTPLVLAWGNDTEFANIYAPQVDCWAEPGDLMIAISGSGNSPNIINAVERANALGAHSFGLAGFSGGKLEAAAKDCITVRTTNMQRIEDLHMIILHMVFSMVRDRNRLSAE